MKGDTGSLDYSSFASWPLGAQLFQRIVSIFQYRQEEGFEQCLGLGLAIFFGLLIRAVVAPIEIQWFIFYCLANGRVVCWLRQHVNCLGDRVKASLVKLGCGERSWNTAGDSKPRMFQKTPGSFSGFCFLESFPDLHCFWTPPQSR